MACENSPDPPSGSDSSSGTQSDADERFDDLLQAAVRPPDTLTSDSQQPLQFMRLPVGTVVSERFVVEWCVGTGGMGDVYRCEDRETGGSAALKVIRRVDDYGRFKREASILAVLSHDAIVSYLAHGITATGTPYLAMEWLEGEDLARVLDRTRLSVADSLTLARRVCEALALAHGHGFIHRDVKPSNLFICHGRVELVKVLDFGVAHRGLTTQTSTRAGTMLGTVGYMAPEQAWGMPSPDPRDDLFSVGCVLFECLTGRPAFIGESSVAVLEAVLQVEPPDVRSFDGQIPAPLAELVHNLLRKARKDRPATAEEVMRTLAVLGDRDASERHGTPASAALPPTFAVLVVARGADLAAAPVSETGLLDAIADPASSTVRASTHTGTRLYALATGPELTLVDIAERAMQSALALHDARPELALQVALPTYNVASVSIDELADHLPERTTAAPVERGILAADAVVAALVHARCDPARQAWPDSVRLDGDLPVATRELVGRDAELGVLRAAFDECCADQAAAALLVTGPAGVGKSRLVAEFLASLASEADLQVLIARASWVDCHRPSSLLRALSSATSPEALDPEATFHDMLARRRASAPTIVWIDDAHWADPASLRAICSSLNRLSDRPLLVVATSRPGMRAELRATWQSIGMHEVRLRPLGARAVERYVRAAVGPGASARESLARAVGLADGNPRLLQALVAADGAEGGATFDTAVALFMERLLELPGSQRDVLRAASMFAERVWISGVRAMLGGRPDVDRDIEALCERDLLIVDPSSPPRGSEIEVVFAHAIVREAAHRCASFAERLSMRQLAARWLPQAQLDVTALRLRD